MSNDVPQKSRKLNRAFRLLREMLRYASLTIMRCGQGPVLPGAPDMRMTRKGALFGALIAAALALAALLRYMLSN